MSANACIAYFGLRFDISSDEVEPLEDRSDVRQIAAKRVGLSTYLANFGGTDDRYVLFIGKRIAVLGPEDDRSSAISAEQLSQAIIETPKRLEEAGLAGESALHMEWLEDV